MSAKGPEHHVCDCPHVAAAQRNTQKVLDLLETKEKQLVAAQREIALLEAKAQRGPRWMPEPGGQTPDGRGPRRVR